MDEDDDINNDADLHELLFSLPFLLPNPLLLRLLSPPLLLSACPVLLSLLPAMFGVGESKDLNSGFEDFRLLLAGLREVLAGS